MVYASTLSICLFHISSIGYIHSYYYGSSVHTFPAGQLSVRYKAVQNEPFSSWHLAGCIVIVIIIIIIIIIIIHY